MTLDAADRRRDVMGRVSRGELSVEDAMTLLNGDSTDGGTAELVYFRPQWIRAAQPSRTAGDLSDVVVIAGPEAASWCPPGATLLAWGQEIPATARRGVLVIPTTVDAEGVLETVYPAIRALIADRSRGPMEIACVVPAGARPDLAAALGAFCQIASFEDRRIRAVAISVAQLPGGFSDPVRLGLAELALPTPGSAEVRYDEGGRWLRKVLPVPEPEPYRFALRRTCLITGGAGGIGLQLAGLLAARYQTRSVLMGRSEIGPAARAGLDRIRALGGEVVYHRGDVTRRSDVEAAVQRARDKFGALHGILHSAGINDDRYIINKPADAVRRVLAPKLAGARHLDLATVDDPLDFFVLFSSTAAYLCMAGQSDYAAANRGLGGFAAARTDLVRAGERRGATVSVCWPLWQGGGMDLAESDRRVLAELQGMSPMPVEAGLRAMAAAIGAAAADRPEGPLAPNAESLVVYGDARRARQFVAGRAADRPPQSAGTTAEQPPSPGPDLLGATERWLLGLVESATRLPAGRLHRDQEFSTIGVDSILVKRLTGMLTDALGPQPITLLFEYRSVAELAARLVETHPAELRARPDVAEQPAEPVRSPGPEPELTGTDEPIAIVGLAGRYPGGEDLTEFWASLAAGRDCVTEIPADRWDHSAYYSADGRRPGMSYGRWGGFLRDVARFDTAFFAIAPREAERMDPKERLLCEVAWHAIEDAGYSRSLLHEATREGERHALGVFVGITGASYGLLGAEEWGRGNRVIAPTMDFSTANRLSYFLDAHGPSMVVDTACSGSLTALHLAVESLRRGECRIAIAGGVCINVHPSKWVVLSDFRMLSTDGRCRAFGHAADGFVPGEGVGALVLKPLSAAEADGDHIRGVILATAINHGGKTNGYTVPTPRAQSWLISDALRRSGVPARGISYVEAHGTGTALGDPIEIDGLTRAFAEQTPDTGFCAIGSVKSNIGHTESAAGIAGVTKVLLQFEHEAIAPTLHCEPLNSTIDFAATPFVPSTGLIPWPAEAGRTRRAAVSSFGAGGANGHVILAEYQDRRPQPADVDGAVVVPVCAKTPEQLRTLAARLVDALGPGSNLRDIAGTLQLGREVLEERLAVVASTVDELIGGLRDFLAGRTGPRVFTGRVEPGDAPLFGVDGYTRPENVARAFVAGATIPWRQLLGSDPYRHVPLPGYPFGGGRYWLASTARVGPFHRIPPTLDGATFLATLSREDRLIRDHRVAGSATVAGTFQLELVRAAAAELDLGPVSGFADVRWRRPLVVGESGTEVAVVLRREPNGVSFTIRTDVPHCTGTVLFGQAESEPALPVGGWRSGSRVTGEELYSAASAAGLEYGDAYRRVENLYRQGDAAYAVLVSDAEPVEPDTLPAGLIDSALHAVQGILPAALDGTVVPAGVARVSLMGDPTRARLSRATLNGYDSTTAKCRVVIADEAGTPLAVFEDLLVARTGGDRPKPPDNGQVTMLRPRWQIVEPISAPAQRLASSALVLTTSEDFGLGAQLAARYPAGSAVTLYAPVPAERLKAALSTADDETDIYLLTGITDRWYSHIDKDCLTNFLETQALGLFHLAKALGGRSTAGVRLTVVTSDVQQVDPSRTARNPFAATLLGLTKSVGRELSGIRTSLVDLGRNDLERSRRTGDWGPLVTAVTDPPAGDSATELALRGGLWLANRLEPATLDVPTDADLPFRRGGCYLIVGGAGGLGGVVTRYLAAQWGARCVLIGRRSVRELPAGLLDRLGSDGGEVRYQPGDVADAGRMREVVAWTTDAYGPIHGVVHSAFVLADRTIRRMDEDTFRSALRAKVHGTVVLEEVLADQPLDFIALFSSAISHTANAGQANYAAASTFQDAYGRYLATRLRRPVRVFNWGFWGQSGSVATDAYRERIERSGVQALTDEQGLAAFRQVMAAGAVQIAPIRVDAGLAERAGFAGTPPARWCAPSASVMSTVATAVRDELNQAADLPGDDYIGQLEALARRYIRTALATRPEVVPAQARLFEALKAALDRDPTSSTVDADELRLAILDRYPWSMGALDLLADCASALPDVLAGRRRGIEVLFPGGSSHRLAPLYHDDPRSAHLNRLCARAVHTAVSERLAGNPDRPVAICEVGAGTGGTSRPVFSALAPLSGRFSYDYTDVSPGLVRQAEASFAGACPEASFRVLDITKEPAEQGFQAGGYDIVIASNVLHATPDLRHTVGNVRRLLRPGGLLVLNEATRVLDAVTVIFGLADGWWSYVDHQLRLPHSPLLSAERWHAVLAAAGFATVQPLPASKDREAGQHLVLAERDAWVDTIPPVPTAEPPTLPTVERPAAPVAGDLLEIVSTVVARVLKLPPGELDPRVPLRDYGTDSLVSMEIVDQLGRELGPVPGDLPFDSGSVTDIAQALAGVVPPPQQAPQSMPEPTFEPTAEPFNAPVPIAIVGLAGSYPMAGDVEQYWRNLRAGVCAITEVPADRWRPQNGEYRWGGFLDGVAEFDPLLFGISPREAERIDPQERLFLQTAWVAFDDAGYSRQRLRTSALPVGVFVGAAQGSYQRLVLEGWAQGRRSAVDSPGWSVANRVSHCFGLSGPSLAIDTACSSSLTAIHLACESLRSGECALAIAGGVNLILHPSHHHHLAAAGMLSPAGRSNAFGAAADGFVTGEGVGAVVLKPLPDALRDGDRIYATILGSAVNANGSGEAYLAPNPAGQARLVQRALERGQVDPRSIGYLEAQATGSPLGDRTELAALTAAYREYTEERGYCLIGSVKPNVGHLEAASGIAQLTKVLMQFRYGEIAPTIGCDPPHPDLELAGSPFRLVTSTEPWPLSANGSGPAVRRAAVSSFGAGGANAHLILQEPPTPPPPAPANGAEVVVLSARRAAQLSEYAARIREYVRGHESDLTLADVAHTLRRREPLPARMAVVARDLADLVAGLADFPDAVRDVTPGQDTEQLVALATAWTEGATVEPISSSGRVVSLPPYPFARQRYWLDGTGTDAPKLETGRVRECVVSAIGSILGVPPEDIGDADHLSDFGFDSISIVALADLLAAELGIEVAASALYAHPNVASLVESLASRTGLGVGAPVPSIQTPPAPAQAFATPAPAPAAAPMVEPVRTAEPVAIVGMAGQFPGSPTLAEFWSNVAGGRDLVNEIPADRFDWHDMYGDTREDPDRVASRWGGFLNGIDRFDAEFFQISPREAKLMDPQHRLFLQCVWQAIEDAGHDPTALAGSATGVFVGVASSEYVQLLLAQGVEVDGQLATGNEHSVLANRISFLLDLHGPSEPVDTACSSSLVAIHRAVEAIRTGECEQAIAGGVNLILSPNGFLAFGKSGMLARDGRCKSFDHRADGYVRGEGVGAVLLKPLSRAVADRDRIYAVIRGSATNHGGRATSLTAPNPAAQAAVITAALDRAGIGADTVSYLEAHGTGTALGDPVELDGLVAAFGRRGAGERSRYCGLGSVKTNVGHLETAAGIAGLIKTVLALHHRVIPPTLHLERVNPRLRLAGSPFYLAHTVSHWEQPLDGAGTPVPRRAGVSSFGFGGVNAHVVLEEYTVDSRAAGPDGPQLVVLSARDAGRLREYADRLLGLLDRNPLGGAGPAGSLADIAFTLQTGRPAMRVRLALLADSVDALAAGLRGYLDGSPQAGTHTGTAEESGDAEPGDLNALARAWVAGKTVDWPALHTGRTRRRLSLPTYPFAETRHWLPSTPPPVAVPAPVPAPPSTVEPVESVPVASPVTTVVAEPDAVVTELQAIIAQGVDMEPASIDLNQDFASYGIDSIAALRIMQRVQARYGEEVPMAAIFEHATVQRLADHLVAEHGAAGSTVDAPAEPALLVPTLVPFAAEGDGPPCYAVYGDTGELTWLLAWAAELARTGPAIGLQARGAGPLPAEGIERLAAGCAAAIETDRPSGPLRLAGHGWGGLVALETARLLIDRGREVVELTLVGTPAPGSTVDRTDLAGVLTVFAEAWGGTAPEVTSEDVGEAAVALSGAVPVPMPMDAVRGRLADAVGWRRLLARSARAYRPSPLAGVRQTLVVTTNPEHDWAQWIVPAPAVVELPGQGALAGAAAVTAYRAFREPPSRVPDPEPKPEPQPDDSGSYLVIVNRSGSAPASFWTHHLFGDVSYTVYLSRHLGSGYPLYAVEQIDPEHRFRQFATVEEMSATYLRSVRAQQPQGPYRLGGCSFGGIVAYEMAQQLQEAGEEVSHLYLVDPLMPGTSAWRGVDASGIDESQGESLALMLIGNSACQLWRVPDQLSVADLLGRELDEQFDIMARHVVDGSPATLSERQVQRVMRAKWEVLRLNGSLLDQYEAKPLRGPADVTVFHARRGFSAPGNPFGMPPIPRVDNDPTNGLGSLAPDRLTIHVMDADHFTIVLEENIKIMAGLLRPSLDRP